MTKNLSRANAQGLSRNIPTSTKRAIRRKSKFGCVICRCGFYDYHHIAPSYRDAKDHNPDFICCLCPTCHSAVTRGTLSNETVLAKYKEINAMSSNEAPHPVGPLDFHFGDAQLQFGGLHFHPAVNTILRYHGDDVIKTKPGSDGQPGSISAVFTDDAGHVTLRLEENQWIGDLSQWDVTVTGNRIEVLSRASHTSLRLRLEPPGKVVVEHIDMRYEDIHILANETTFAVGRYLDDETIRWTSCKFSIHKSRPSGAVIDVMSFEDIELHDKATTAGIGGMTTANRELVIDANAGFVVKSIGVSFASLCGGFDAYSLPSLGIRPLPSIRHVIFKRPQSLLRYIGTGNPF